jgi:type I restriction enzyme S subunit
MKNSTTSMLGDISEYITSGSRDWSKYYSDTGALFVRTQDINKNRLDTSSSARVALPDKVEGKRTRLKKGDLLVTITGANVGKCAVVDWDIEEAYVSQSVALIRLKCPDTAKFIYHQLTCKDGDQTYLEKAAYGLGRPVLNLTNMREVPVVQASPEIQKGIVAEIEKQFSRLDEAVTSLKRIQANLKRYKAAVLKAAVEGKLTEQWRKDHPAVAPADQLLKRILAERRAKWEAEELAKMKTKGIKPKDDSWKKKYKEPAGPDTANLPELPEGWVWANVDQLAEVGTGATPRRDRPEYYENGDVPWVTSAVVNKPFVDEASEYVTSSALAETNLTQYPIGTLLVAMYGEGKTRGKCSELRISASTNQALAALQTDPSIHRYLRLFLDYNYEETRKVASGGVQPNLNLSLVRSIRIPLPPLYEQPQIVVEIDRRLSVTEEIETTIVTNLKRAERLRQTILQQAFLGGLV